MDIASSQLLTSKLIFTGNSLRFNMSDFIFMNYSNARRRVRSSFDERVEWFRWSTWFFRWNYWQTNATLMIYLSHIRMENAHVAGVEMILDKASTNCSNEVKGHSQKNELSWSTVNPHNFHKRGTNIYSASSRCCYHKTTKEWVPDPTGEGSIWQERSWKPVKTFARRRCASCTRCC